VYEDTLERNFQNKYKTKKNEKPLKIKKIKEKRG